MPKSGGLSYDETGEGEPVLLIHGGIVAGAFRPLTREPLLANEFRLIRYDRMGMGDSDRQSAAYGPIEHARDAAALLRALGTGPAHLVGHSYGGAVALQVALDDPDMVRSLVLIEPAIYGQVGVGGGAAMNERIMRLVELHRSGDSAGAVDRFMLGAEGPEWKESVEKVLPGAVAQAEKDAPANFDHDIPNLLTWDFGASQASRITQPVLYLIGGGRPLQEAAFGAFKALVPQTRKALVPDALHSLHHQRPAEVAEAIHAFLSAERATTGGSS